MATADNLNKLGHRMGARGARTRGAILDALRRLLSEKHLGEIRTGDVAMAAGVSAPSFYTYFQTVDEVVLALCEQAADEYPALAAYIDADWSGPQGLESARAYVTGVLEFWREHGAALRVENLLADDGQEAFIRTRIRRLRRIHFAFERRIAQARSSGFHAQALDPRLASYEVASLVDGVAAGFGLLRRAETSSEAIVDTTALLVLKLVTGR